MAEEDGIPIFSCPKAHEPLANYFASVYMTLLSIIQSLALAGLFSSLYNDLYPPHFYLSENLPRYAVAIMIILLVWHKYINHHQFIGWQLTWKDSFIIFAFGTLESFFVLFSGKEYSWWHFYFLLAVIYILGAVAYKYAAIQHNEEYVKPLFQDHYNCGRNNRCDENIRNFMIYFENKSFSYTLKSGAVLILFVILIYIYKETSLYIPRAFAQIPDFPPIINNKSWMLEIVLAGMVLAMNLHFIMHLDLKNQMKSSTAFYLNACEHQQKILISAVENTSNDLDTGKEQDNNTVYEQLSRKELRERMSDSFPSVHLTIMSIVQGVALGFLGLKTFDYILKNPSQDKIITIIPYFCLSFSAIVITSYEYNWYVGVYRWSPKLRDTFIPFLLGISQIGPLFFLDKHKWWWAFNAILVSAGAFAFHNTLYNCRRDMFDSKEAYNICKKGTRFDFYFTSMIFLVPSIVFLIYYFGISSKKLLYWYRFETVGFLIYAIMMYLLTKKDEEFLRELHEYYKLKY